MAKHNMFRSQLPPKPSKLPVHPIWRGIGCILLAVLPIASYFISSLLIDNKDKYSWLVIPEDILLRNYPKDPMIVVRLLYAVIILVGMIAVLSLSMSLVMRFFAPSKYDPVDIPPDKIIKP